MSYKKVLIWTKPEKIMTEKERREEGNSDSEILGTYMPNMSGEDQKAWKAKLTGYRAGHPQVEIRKDTSVIIIALHGYKYKHYTPEDTRDYAIHISSAGPIQWTSKELDEFQVAIAEAKAVLIEVDKRIKDARAKKKDTSSTSNASVIDGEMGGDIQKKNSTLFI